MTYFVSNKHIVGIISILADILILTFFSFQECYWHPLSKIQYQSDPALNKSVSLSLQNESLTRGLFSVQHSVVWAPPPHRPLCSCTAPTVYIHTPVIHEKSKSMSPRVIISSLLCCYSVRMSIQDSGALRCCDHTLRWRHMYSPEHPES